MTGVPGAAAWTRQTVPSTSALPVTMVDRSPVGAELPIIGMGMIAIGMSQPAVASQASVWSSSIASGETGQ